MPTSESLPAWFYWQKAENLFTASPRTQTTILAEMIDAVQTEADAQYLRHELDEYINIILHEDSTPLPFTKSLVAKLTEALEVAKDKQRSLQARYKMMQDKVSANKSIIESLENQVMALLQDNDLTRLELDNGVECKVVKSPGALKASRDPEEKDLKELGPTLVRQSFSWNLVNLKAALAEGVVDHAWMERNGFALVRNNSVKIAKTEGL